ncbi:hypothetical protein CLHUN_26180 [Ruminiclostridium hungatei]|uniref:Uncharacterized protein n=1 Tax=Ruminiclostridium hungatei TaxID=48256 RepID=A0A1V4SJQ3_RUMHU|nr:hypothetical protein [Ruminiclostridium hungatei]OPX43471.1 hypothetical protein CLHUN_26180 [Ruminiclostridium hungatei]
MMRRVLAWILLAGFVLLLLNIVFFHVFQMQSVAVYAIIAVWFIFSNKPLPSNKIIKTGENAGGTGLENFSETQEDIEEFQGDGNENVQETSEQ